jgi:arabinose-5-phosphate isomerase
MRPSEVKKELRRVLALEASALRRLRSCIDDSYVTAVRWILGCRGKVILLGMGKSGLIAQKIASTLASTGTPALYLHPSEALHGGLGVVQRRDLVLALGKSGETDELNDILPSLRRLKTRIIALTANPESTLARSSDLILDTPRLDEACPLNLAPTASTTAALAIGDALAIALMRARGFRKEEFARNHPGGQLGKRLTLRVSDIMRKGKANPVVRLTASLRHMLVELTRQHAGAVSVVDGRGRLKGLITDCDIRTALEKGVDLRGLRISDLMNPGPTRVQAGDLAAKAVDLMKNRRRPFSVMPVVDRRGRAVGMLQVHDLRALGL